MDICGSHNELLFVHYQLINANILIENRVISFLVKILQIILSKSES